MTANGGLNPNRSLQRFVRRRSLRVQHRRILYRNSFVSRLSAKPCPSLPATNARLNTNSCLDGIVCRLCIGCYLRGDIRRRLLRATLMTADGGLNPNRSLQRFVRRRSLRVQHRRILYRNSFVSRLSAKPCPSLPATNARLNTNSCLDGIVCRLCVGCFLHNGGSLVHLCCRGPILFGPCLRFHRLTCRTSTHRSLDANRGLQRLFRGSSLSLEGLGSFVRRLGVGRFQRASSAGEAASHIRLHLHCRLDCSVCRHGCVGGLGLRRRRRALHLHGCLSLGGGSDRLRRRFEGIGLLVL